MLGITIANSDIPFLFLFLVEHVMRGGALRTTSQNAGFAPEDFGCSGHRSQQLAIEVGKCYQIKALMIESIQCKNCNFYFLDKGRK